MKRCVKANGNAASIYSATKDYSQYGLDEIERELMNKIGSRVAADPAILVNLGTGESGMIAETADGDIILDNLDTGERVWGAQNVIEAVLTSWDKSID